MTMLHEAFEEIACNLCGSREVEEIYSSTLPQDFSIEVTKRFAPADHANGNDRVVRCTKCGLVYISPRMKEEYIWQGYSEAIDEKYKSQSKDRLTTFKRALSKIESYLPERGKMLDVGCAAGFFLKIAKDFGWQVEGIEPNCGLALWGSANYGIPIRSVKFLQAAFPCESFDVVTFWDVLEHVTDPKAYLREAFRILKPGGFLFINFPDFGCPLARLTGKKWWFLSPVHIFYFTRQTLKKFLEKEGFAVKKMECHFQTLSLGYLFERFSSYSRGVSKIGATLVNFLGLTNMPIRYYASQALAVAQKPK